MNKKDIKKIDAVLNIIAKDEELIKEFAAALGEDEEEFGNWIDTVKVD